MTNKSPRFVSSPFKHSFHVDDVLMQVIGPCNVTQYLVEEVISDSKIKVLVFLPDGSFSPNPRFFEGNDLKWLSKNELATKLFAHYSQENQMSA